MIWSDAALASDPEPTFMLHELHVACCTCSRRILINDPCYTSNEPPTCNTNTNRSYTRTPVEMSGEADDKLSTANFNFDEVSRPYHLCITSMHDAARLIPADLDFRTGSELQDRKGNYYYG